MRAKTCLFVAVGLLLGADTPKEDPAVKEVEKALNSLNEAFAKQDLDGMKKFMAEDHIAITTYYGRQTRDEQLKSEADLKITEYKPTEMKTEILSKDLARITYAVAMKGTYKGKEVPAKSLALSLWVKRDGKWLEVAYTETPVAGK